MTTFTQRGSRTNSLWLALWFALGLLVVTLAFDAWRRSVPAAVWLLWFAPLLVLLPGVARDRLRSVTWLCFVSLMYFVLAVLRIFAEPDSLRAQVELLAVIGVFSIAMFYIRERGRELRALEPAAHPVSED